MVNVTIGDLLQESFTPESKLVFENLSALTKRSDVADASTFPNGSTVELIAKLTDLPSVTNGFIQLDPTKSYLFTEPFDIPNTILVPAGYSGFLKASFFDSVGQNFTGGVAPMFATLNIDGVISSIVDAGGGFITVTTSASHGILDGQFVNITGTTSYNQNSLVVSNVTASTFDVMLSFVGDEAGAFNTGYEILSIFEHRFSNTAGTGTLFDVTSSGSFGSVFFFDSTVAGGFSSPGIVRNSSIIAILNSFLSFGAGGGLIIENVGQLTIAENAMPSFGGGATDSSLILTGSTTNNVIVNIVTFDLELAGQHAIRIDPSVPDTASIRITNSPDNNVATDYFDTASGGLDETNPIVSADNNGTRKNSMSSAQVGFTNIATPIVVTLVTQDVPVIIGGTQFISDNLERASTTTGGQITNTTKKTQGYPITFSGLIEKVGGGSTDIGLLLIKNGSLVLTETFEIPHSVNTGIIQISATRDFTLANGDTLDIAVVNFDGTADISVSQANISYSLGS